ncbi:DUF1566 domain-containing protein [Duganella violaceipulchra]|uniref:DUF1566 domain-containing protein n=1 Tax=Duganella violaceipulchra TaxID=2849652 RepID=A0AA41L040_9BURK|nr:DUF1566 domain-containing protein [Duganella violaceicalia]MBV6321941.1 DUF1566 domain-containing protein [Duganella violaceicalia]MCP2007065.1 hypothetical protein [Duganella violaceicalia]
MDHADVLHIIEDRTFTAKMGERTITGLMVESTWNGLTNYTAANGANLVVLDAERRVVTGSAALLVHLGLGEPQIGAEFSGGIYAGLTEVDGKPARLIMLLPHAVDVSWDTAMDWAKLQGGHLPTRAEQRTLIENVKSHFEPRWYWSCDQHADFPSYAWLQLFGNGYQVSYH